jgi:hypothetical protein
MPIEYKKKQAFLRDIVTVDEAEGLLEWLQNKPGARIDLGQCSHLHPANLQVLMAADCKVSVWPADAAFSAWLQSALKPQ